MRKFLGVLFFVLSVNAYAQRFTYKTAPWSYEAGFSVGAMNGNTDVGQNLNYKGTRPELSLHAGAYHLEKWGIRFELSLGALAGKDKWKKLDSSLKTLRNLSYRTTISEAAVLFEIQPFNWWKWYKGDMFDITPYALTGIGVFHFRPKTNFQGKWIDLQPLHIEGQGFAEYPDRKPYKLTQLCIPVGIGAKYDYNWDFSVRLEFLYRFLFTDYIDDVSEARTNTALYPKYLSPENAELAKKLYNRRWEIDPINTKATGPRGNQNRDGYLTFNVKFCWTIQRDWLW